MIRFEKQEVRLVVCVCSYVAYSEIRIVDGPTLDEMKSAELSLATHFLDEGPNQRPLEDLIFSVYGLERNPTKNRKRKVVIKKICPVENKQWQEGVFSFNGTVVLFKNKMEVVGVYDSKSRKGVGHLLKVVAEVSPTAEPAGR